MSIESSKLKESEWVFLLTTIIFILTFFFIAKKTSLNSLAIINDSSPIPPLTIEVTGCVKKPGVYSVIEGTTLRSVIKKAHLRPLADLTNISLDQPLEQSQTIEIPQLQKIVVEVQGCVEEGASLIVPVGSRICDLKNLVRQTNDADPAFFRRRRMLKNHEMVLVPPRGRVNGATD